MKRKKIGKIGILMGGPSTEREISIKSGKAVYEALGDLGLDVFCVDINSDSFQKNRRILKSKKIDCAFIALHGRFGEDGQIQEVLESLDIPYTGSGVEASKLAMDKVKSRIIFETIGLSVPRYIVLKKNLYNRNRKFDNCFNFPVVIKPASHGSSIGLSIVDKKSNVSKAIELAFSFDEVIIIEEYIKGRELTAGILNDRALPLIEIIPKNRFFDYEAKYSSGSTEYIVPAKLDSLIDKQVKIAALAAHKTLGCFGCSRVDLILDNKGDPFILEVNTIPGLTATSLLPKAANCIGIKFEELCLQLIKLAYEKAEKKIGSSL